LKAGKVSKGVEGQQRKSFRERFFKNPSLMALSCRWGAEGSGLPAYGLYPRANPLASRSLSNSLWGFWL